MKEALRKLLLFVSYVVPLLILFSIVAPSLQPQ